MGAKTVSFDTTNLSTMKRKILVILCNRLSPSQPARYVEMDCKDDGSILAERPLKSKPRKASYDEVWQNDEGKDCVKFCHRIKRLYRHALEKSRA
jgi:hypothetical protein